jgi:hypothetical protein
MVKGELFQGPKGCREGRVSTGFHCLGWSGVISTVPELASLIFCWYHSQSKTDSAYNFVYYALHRKLACSRLLFIKISSIDIQAYTFS